MNFIHSVFHMTARRIRQTRATSLFFIFGMMFSMLLVSLGISFISEHLAAQNAKKKAMPPNGEQFSFTCSGADLLEYEKVLQMFDGLGTGSGIIVNHLMIHPNAAGVNEYCPVSAEMFSADEQWHYPVISGRYFTASEIQEAKKVVLIGETLEKYEREEGGKKYIDFEGEPYEVIGVVGMANQLSMWDARVFMPFTALPEETKQMLEAGSEMGFILYSSSNIVKAEAARIKAKGEEFFSDFGVESYGPIEVENVMQDVANSQDQIFAIAILGYVVTLIYAINIVVFWIERRRYEIGLRKAFGYTNGAIAQMIYGEMLGMTALACIGAIVLQGIISVLVGRVSGYTYMVYASNVASAVLIVLVTAAIISIWPIRRAIRIQPAVALREDGENA